MTVIVILSVLISKDTYGCDDHERLSMIILRHKLQLMNITCTTVLHFSHSRVSENVHKAYTTMSVTWFTLITRDKQTYHTKLLCTTLYNVLSVEL
jgi:hypothetical protein